MSFEYCCSKKRNWEKLLNLRFRALFEVPPPPIPRSPFPLRNYVIQFHGKKKATWRWNHKLAPLLRYVGEITQCRFFCTGRLLWTAGLTVCLHIKSLPRIIFIYLTLILFLGFTAEFTVWQRYMSMSVPYRGRKQSAYTVLHIHMYLIYLCIYYLEVDHPRCVV